MLVILCFKMDSAFHTICFCWKLDQDMISLVIESAWRDVLSLKAIDGARIEQEGKMYLLNIYTHQGAFLPPTHSVN